MEPDAKKLLSQAYDNLQDLKIEATKGNLEILIMCLHAMKTAYDQLDKIQKQNSGKEVKKDGAD